MKVLVAYMSQTGNTKKVAEAIYDGIDEDKEIEQIEKVESLEGYDMAFLGFPIHGEGPDKKTVRLLEKHCTGDRKVALFITHASPEGTSEELQQWLNKFRQAACGANIVGMFDCQGQLGKVIKFVMSMLPNAKYRMWAKYDTSQGQPDETRLERARAFSREVMNRLRHVEAETRVPVAF